MSELAKHRAGAVHAISHAIGLSQDETDDRRLSRTLLVTMTTIVGLLAVGWGGVYASLDEPLAASMPLAFAILSAVTLLVLRRTNRIDSALRTEFVLIVFTPFALAVALGGFFESSGVALWSLLGPIIAFLIGERRTALRWLVIYLVLVVALALLHPWLRTENNLPTVARLTFFALNFSTVSVITFGMIFYFVGENQRIHSLLEVEKEKSERLLNVLPNEIADILRDEDRTIAEQFDSTSIFFAGIVGFTSLSASMEPVATVELLNEVFTYFDSLTQKYGVEKVRTIGDNYVVVSGAPRQRDDHAQALTKMAIDMRDWLDTNATFDGGQLRFLIGINSGPIVASVIGTTKFHDDVWGDAVNVASRMEAHGEPGRIQIGPSTYESAERRLPLFATRTDRGQRHARHVVPRRADRRRLAAVRVQLRAQGSHVRLVVVASLALLKEREDALAVLGVLPRLLKILVRASPRALVDPRSAVPATSSS